MLERNVLRDFYNQVFRRENGLAVASALAAIRHAIADRNTCNCRMPVDYDSRSCVSKRRVFLKLGPYFGDRRTRPHAFESFPYLVELRRIVSDFLDNAFVVDTGAFSSTADK